MTLRRSAALAAVITGLSGAAVAQDGTLTIGISQYPSTLHPSMEAATAKSYVLNMAQRPITTFDAEWNPICMLCIELPTLENGGAVLETTPDGKDGIAVTYTLQPDATWGDGTPLTTADIIMAWDVGRHPQSSFDNIELYRSIYKIDVADDKTFTLHIDKVDFQYNMVNDLHPLPAHLERAVFDADPVEYKTRTTYVTDPLNPGLYFGPYKITEIESGATIILDKNETWYGDPPNFDRIVVRTVENTAALEANLLAGDVDMIAGELGITIDQGLAFQERHGDDYNIIFKPGLIYEHIDLKLDNPVLADVRVRKGLLYALDRQTLVDELFQGQQVVAKSNVSPLDWTHDDKTPSYDYDPEQAVRLFEEAGYTELVNGVRQNANGDRLSFEFMTTAGNRIRELVQQVLQQQWAEVGVEVTIKNEPARAFFGGTLSERKFTGMALFAWVSSPENVPRTTTHSDHIPKAENNWSGQNYTGFANPEYDRLIEEIEVELDREKRGQLWSQLQALYAQELPALPLFYRSDVYVLPKWLEGVVPTGHQYGSTLWIEQWHRAAA